MKSRAKSLVACLVVALAGTLLPHTAVHADALHDCATDGNHSYGRANSGWGSQVVGTGATTVTPTQWPVDRNQNGGKGGTTDEAVWVFDNNSNSGTSIESGYFSGYWPYGGGFFTGLVPYFTLNNGSVGARAGGFLNANKSIWMATRAYLPGSSVNGAAAVDWAYFDLGHYTVATPTNLEQGEVTGAPGSSWMGGGKGESFLGYYQPASGYPNAWYNWGFSTTCANSPYWASGNNPGSGFSNGGF